MSNAGALRLRTLADHDTLSHLPAASIVYKGPSVLPPLCTPPDTPTPRSSLTLLNEREDHPVQVVEEAEEVEAELEEALPLVAR